MKRAWAWAAGCLLLLAPAGCRHVQDISGIPPHSGQVGLRYRLSREAELLKKETVVASYSVCFERLPGTSDAWVVCTLPAGYPVQVEAIKRVTGRLLIGGMPFEEKYAVISLDHPQHPEARIRAELYLEDFKDLKPADAHE